MRLTARDIAITAQIKTKQQAIDRYHTAFENGTMDDTIAGPRLRELRDQIDLLQARRDQITDAISAQPAPPPPGTFEHLATYLRDVTAAGTTAERKAAIEALIHEIRITEQGLIPVYQIPAPDSPIPGHDDTTPVRTMVGSVGPVGFEPTLAGS